MTGIGKAIIVCSCIAAFGAILTALSEPRFTTINLAIGVVGLAVGTICAQLTIRDLEQR